MIADLLLLLTCCSGKGADGNNDIEMKGLTSSTSSPPDEDQPDTGPDDIKVMHMHARYMQLHFFSM